MLEMKSISVPAGRLDFSEKMTGAAKFCQDLRPHGMFYAKTLRSSKPRAKIRAVRLPLLPDNVVIVDWRDVRGKNIVPIVTDDQPFFARDQVNYIGEPILVATGPNPDELRKIIDSIQVDYEELPAVLTIEEALSRTSDIIYGDHPWFVSYEYLKGDPDTAIHEAAISVEDEFHTGYQEQAYLEPQSMLAEQKDGVMTVRGSMQCPFYVEEALMQALGWERTRVRVIQLPTGGGFGGKEDYPSIPAVHAALAAIKTGRPVMLVYDRGEDIMCTTKRHPSCIRVKSHLDANNHIIAREIEVLSDAGAYCGLSGVVLQRMIYSVPGVYQVQNLRVSGRACATNKVPSGAFRGFGGPQAFFAIEMHMEHVAREIGVDPLLFRKTHFLRQGDLTATGGRLRSPVELEAITDSVCTLSDYYEKRSTPKEPGGKLRGIGFSAFFHGCGFTGADERDIISARVRLCKGEDETVNLYVSSAELGQGAITTLSKIAAETLDIPLSQVLCGYPDTGVCPNSGPTVASRTILVVGRLVQEAALKMKEHWDEAFCETESHFRYPGGFSFDKKLHTGDAYLEYAWGANVVEVEVDPITYSCNILGAWAAFDIGTPIDTTIAAGQVHGGMAQGLGYGCMEVLDMKAGRPLQCSLTDYMIPTSLDVCKIDFRFVQSESVLGPYGARGMGELTLVGAAPALAAAVENAIGKPVTQLPVTSEYIMELSRHG
jgi:CO/xanthine dehydrogenase Mo-binding subunit